MYWFCHTSTCIRHSFSNFCSGAFLISQWVKNLPAMQEILVGFLCQEDLLEKGEATHSSMLGLPLWLSCEESTCIARDLGSISGLGRCPGEGKGYPPQYSGLEKSMNCIVHRVTKSQTPLNNFHFHYTLLHSPFGSTSISE